MEELAGSRLQSATGIPVGITAGWTEKVVATRQPAPDEWIERTVEWHLTADEDLHVAVILIDKDGGEYRMLPEAASVLVRLSFSRERAENWPDWPPDKQVRVSLETLAAVVVSESLWLDPRAEVRVGPLPDLRTGSVVTIAELGAVDLTARLVVLGPGDVRVTHGRWKADPAVLDLLPPELGFLSEGQRSGPLT